MNHFPKPTSRRSFLQSGSRVLAAAGLASYLHAETPASKARLFSALGLSGPLEKASFFKEQGAEFLTLSTGDFLVPDQPDAEFEKNLARLAASALPVLACNGFIRPKHLRCTGPDANHDQVLDWANTCFRRLKKAKGKFIVFGSGGSRQLPDGWAREMADEQFVSLLKRMGPLAEAHGVVVTIEQLQAKECNYINHIAEAATLIRATAHPHIRLLADLYHMTSMGDTPADLKAAMDVVVHMEIAEKEGRTVPGVGGEDFRPFFRVLREAGYQGAISMEGKWTDEQLGNAFKEIARQAADA